MTGSTSVSCLWLTVMAVLVLVLVSAAAEDGQTHSQGSTPVVATRLGKVSGVVEQSTKGKTFYSYYSIPFAQPPVGPLRLHVPVEAESWEGVRAGTRQPTPCLQVTFTSVLYGTYLVLGEEDCLYLNVFTPESAVGSEGPKRNLPVLVFIHGGGFIGGRADLYQANGFLNHDIVLVTIQYRLNFLGFLSTEDEALPGNFGLHDQVMALQWVADNIRNFGGDPTSITLSGQSAGACSAHLLLLSPKSRGLISRAILQSGSSLCGWSTDIRHKEHVLAIASKVGCGNQTDSSHQLVQCLREVDGRDLVTSVKHLIKFFIFPSATMPRVDGDLLPEPPELLAKRGSYPLIPIIIGTTLHDGGLFVYPMYGREEMMTSFTDNFEEIGPIAFCLTNAEVDDPLYWAHQIVRYYMGGLDIRKENAHQFLELYTDFGFRTCHAVTATLHAQMAPAGTTFSYLLAYKGQHSVADEYNVSFPDYVVTHSDEMFYMFPGNKRWKQLTTARDLAFSDLFTQLWVNFVTTGNPTPDSSLGFTWEATNHTDLRHLLLSDSPSMIHEPVTHKQAREFWASIPTRQNRLLRESVEDEKRQPRKKVNTEL